MFMWDIIDNNIPIPNLTFLLLIFLLLVSVNINEIKINVHFLFVLLFIVAQGIVNVILGNDTFVLLFSQVIAIAICFVTYDNIISFFTVSEVMNAYWFSALAMALIGDIEAILSIPGNSAVTKLPIVFTYTTFSGVVGPFPRLASLCHEPSFLGYFLAPAVCLYLCKFISPEYLDDKLVLTKNNWQGIAILIAYVMTFSSTAYIGLGLMLLILWWTKGISFQKVIIPIAGALLFNILYNFVSDFKMRFDDTVAAFDGTKVGGSVNLSTYTLSANQKVTESAFKYTLGLGSGLGSYQNMFDKFNPGSWGNSGISLNKTDANSAALRISTELGIFGIIIVLYFLISSFRKYKDKLLCYSCALLVLFLMILFRQGNYTHGGIFLFICLYLRVAKLPPMKDDPIVINSGKI